MCTNIRMTHFLNNFLIPKSDFFLTAVLLLAITVPSIGADATPQRITQSPAEARDVFARNHPKSADAQKTLGDAYAKGEGVAQNDRIAVDWYRKAALQGLASAQSALGGMLFNGRGARRDAKEAAVWIRKAAEQGYAVAQFNLGALYLDGRGVAYDPNQGIVWQRRAAEQGLRIAQYALGRHYYNANRFTGVDEASGSVWYMKAADQGDINAQYIVGSMIGFPIEAQADEFEAGAVWYRKAADLELANARFDFGVRLKETPTTWEESIGWLYGTILQGLKVAQYTSRRYYFDLIRNHITNSEPTSAWYKNAMRAGADERAQASKNRPQAEIWYRKAAEGGLANAQFDLGEHLAGKRATYLESVEWLRKAAFQGHPKAQVSLGRVYLLGELEFGAIPRDYKQALEWLGKAAKNGEFEARKMLWQIHDLAHGVKPRENLGVINPQTPLERSYALRVGDALKEPKTAYLDDTKLNAPILDDDFDNGRCVPFDENQTTDWYRRAAERGDASAQYDLGVIYSNGLGVPEDHRAAVEWVRRAAASGDANAEAILGDFYRYGREPRDLRLALAWYQKAALQDNAKAQYELGSLFLDQKKDPKKSFAWYLKAAKDGHVDAAREVAELYDGAGEGTTDFTPTDIKEAIKWYTVAADNGNVEAQEALTNHYRDGNGVSKDMRLAIGWWEKASMHGSASATEILGDLYAHGVDATRDETKALNYYLTASTQGANHVGPRIADMYATLHDDAQEFSWRKAAATSPSAWAEDKTRFGDLYAIGRGVAQDYRTAAQWYRQAAASGNTGAQFSLAVQYSMGQGVAKDSVAAYFLFTLAADGGEFRDANSASHFFGFEPAIKSRDALAATMSPEEIAQGEALVRQWKLEQPLPTRVQ
jgi:TPR repeat protein